MQCVAPIHPCATNRPERRPTPAEARLPRVPRCTTVRPKHIWGVLETPWINAGGLSQPGGLASGCRPRAKRRKQSRRGRARPRTYAEKAVADGPRKHPKTYADTRVPTSSYHRQQTTPLPHCPGKQHPRWAFCPAPSASLDLLRGQLSSRGRDAPTAPAIHNCTKRRLSRDARRDHA